MESTSVTPPRPAAPPPRRPAQPTAQPTARPTLRQAFAANLPPALILWSAAALLLAFYSTNASFRGWLEQLAVIKRDWGIWFVMPAQALAAAWLPLLFQRLPRRAGKARPPRTPVRQLPFLSVYWALLGVLTSGLYDLQAVVFGDSPALGVVLKKTAVDMLGYTPFISIPLVVWAYALKDNGYSLAHAHRALGRNWYTGRVLPVYWAALIVWTPTLCVLYALPLALQFPVQAIVQCFWGLILVFLTRDEAPAEPQAHARVQAS